MVDKAAEDLKLIKLLKDVCGQPIRKLLQDVIEEIGFSSFTDFLWEGDNQRTLAHLRNRSSSQVHGKSVCKRVLGNKQWMKLFEGRGTKIKQHLKASNGSYKPRNRCLGKFGYSTCMQTSLKHERTSENPRAEWQNKKCRNCFKRDRNGLERLGPGKDRHKWKAVDKHWKYLDAYWRQWYRPQHQNSSKQRISFYTGILCHFFLH